MVDQLTHVTGRSSRESDSALAILPAFSSLAQQVSVGGFR